jgi:uncharacterized protein (DUF362 family)
MTVNNRVIVKKLASDHQQVPFTQFLPLSEKMVADIKQAVAAIFDELGGPSLLKSSRDVYLKPNVVGGLAYTYTRPEVVEAAIDYWLKKGARQIYVFENSTRASVTRLVFELAGYNSLCKRTGAIPVYLDEEDTVPYSFPGKSPVTSDPRGYELTTFRMPRLIHEKLILEKDANLYVSLPKLKTHSMSVVTLGIKNQWGFPIDADRGPDHNYNLHHKLIDVLSHVQPDVTLIEGVEGTIYGHYPALALADRCIRPFRVLIGGLNVMAVDIVGAGIFGKRINDVPHLKIALDRGMGGGITSEQDVTITGDCHDYHDLDLFNEWSSYGGQYPHVLPPEYPEDIAIIKGKEMACPEGCVNGSLTTLQMMSFDYHGKGGWTLVMGKGFDAEVIRNIKDRVLVVGSCAVEEIGGSLVDRLGRGKVYLAPGCCELRFIVESMCHLMKVSPFELVAPLNFIKALFLILLAKCHNTNSKWTNALAKLIKLR